MTRVIKVGGRPQGDPALAQTIAEAWDALNRSLVLVHGGGDEVTALQKAFGLTAQFVDGKRVTTARDMELVRMALSGSANKRLVAMLVREGVRAVGISGEDASLIAATPTDAERLGHVGEPQRINASLVWHLLDGGYLPVISPVSRNVGLELGATLNVNGDDAAAAIAVALEAEELLLVSDVPGVLDGDQVVPTLDIAAAEALIARGTAVGGMAAKLRAGITAVKGGVATVRISDLAAITNRSRGTTLTRGSAAA
ncbi:MAG TPA: acetylglutamate kinase [Gemmatimonadaceae bacterium]|jgi:acetylglutamate kinase|nr:acetylglutamate kinase [Gemmatimonadaceae bacterium]